ncbi:MAG: aspartate aminotransferase family protein [Spirochaetes bacterium]|nr:aspartate aminotransferase family protein [Spirochaetota bacterium]
MGIMEDSNKYVLNTYNRYPLVFDHGQGMWIYTDDGNQFLDMTSGIAVLSLGHSHTKLVEAIQQQSKKLLHTSNLYYSEPYTLLSKKLIEKSVFDKVFFCNSGGEANEAAIKMSRKHGKKIGANDKFKIITMKNSFHGRTMATISATGQQKYQKDFEPLLDGFDYVELNNNNELKKIVSNETSAIIIELVQGEGGIHLANPDFVSLARDLCNEYNSLLIFDEVQTGIGRTGKLFGYQHFLPVEPDIITLAKGLGGGMPIGAMLVKEKIVDLLKPGEHAATFGGNLVCCAAANAVLDTIEEEKLLENVEKMGIYFRNKLNELKDKYPCIKEVRGIGLLNGIEINFPSSELINKLIENNIITIPAGNNIVRFLPPLIVKQEHIDIVIEALDKILKKQ